MADTHIYSYPREGTDVMTHILHSSGDGSGGGSASGIQYTTTAPTEDNPDGDLKFVILSEEPAQKYEGYFYIILEG